MTRKRKPLLTPADCFGRVLPSARVKGADLDYENNRDLQDKKGVIKMESTISGLPYVKKFLCEAHGRSGDYGIDGERPHGIGLKNGTFVEWSNLREDAEGIYEEMGLRATTKVKQIPKNNPDEDFREKEVHEIIIENAEILPITILYKSFERYSRRFASGGSSAMGIYPSIKIYVEDGSIKESQV